MTDLSNISLPSMITLFMSSHLRTTGCHRSTVSHNFTYSPTY